MINGNAAARTRSAAYDAPLTEGKFVMLFRRRAVALGLLAGLCISISGPARAAELSQLLQSGRVPGLAFAVVRDGKITGLGAAGVRDMSTGVAVDDNTIFEAASLSKPVFAYAVLQLVDAGVLSLDTPLSKYVPDYVNGDPRAAAITVADVLSQSSGLPNWRGWLNPLRTNFEPGSRFSYSGEGYIWLQQVVIAATRESLNSLMTRLIFEPLKMKDSSYIWRADFDARYAVPHNDLNPGNKARPIEPLVAYTLHTTAADYARFLQAVLSGSRLKRATAEQWLDPRITVRQRCIECLNPNADGADQHVAWGLGWGLEPEQGAFFH